ncbi:reverse transcriptase-like protein [Shouchella shacheensis]|uniref:reverse transcriptase-like protein n=1 Tax=Shouchella shacheensis TaxID=1649580 RepID=UPI00346217B2
MNTDGASAGDPGPSGVGILFRFADGRTEEKRFAIGEYSNHEAEFEALNRALSICLERGYAHVSFRTDSRLVAEGVENRYVRNAAYAPYLEQVLKKYDQLELAFIKWIPSKQNKKADELARLAIVKEKKRKRS